MVDWLIFMVNGGRYTRVHGLEGFPFFLQYVLISMSVMEGKSWDFSHHQTAIVSVFETCW